MYTHIYMYTYVHIYRYVYVCMQIHVYTYTCTYICTYQSDSFTLNRSLRVMCREMLKGAKVKDHKPVASMADTHAAVREAQKAAARFYTTMDKTVAAKATVDSRADALKAWKDATSALREAKKNKEPEDNLLALQAMVDDAMADIKEANRQAALLKQAAEGGSADQEGGGASARMGTNAGAAETVQVDMDEESVHDDEVQHLYSTDASDQEDDDED